MKSSVCTLRDLLREIISSRENILSIRTPFVVRTIYIENLMIYSPKHGLKNFKLPTNITSLKEYSILRILYCLICYLLDIRYSTLK